MEALSKKQSKEHIVSDQLSKANLREEARLLTLP
jgi:hypothetical protein